jgi:ABC-type transport system involved in multi-copper enzyme maturation permease subunit
MFARVAAFEFRYQLRSPVFWAVIALFFVLTFGAMASSEISIGDPNSSVHKNGPLSLALMQMIMAVFFMFVSTAFVANVIVRDDESGFGPIIRSTRITRFDYLFGRFVGAFAVVALAFLAVPLGSFVGSVMPWVDPETLGPNRFAFYMQPYVTIVLPTLLLSSALFFAVATITRSVMLTYVGVLAFLLLYGISRAVLATNPDLREIAALTDSFGLGAVGLVTRYWTAAEANSRLVPLAGVVLVNRLIWSGVALTALLFAWWRFRFGVASLSARKHARLARKAARIEAVVPQRVGVLPAPDQAAARWPRLFTQIGFEMRLIIGSPAFFVLLLVGLLNSVAAMLLPTGLYGTPTYPATFLLIRSLQGGFTLAPLIIAGFYAGELVWRDRDRRMHEIIDATALPNWAQLVPKFLALIAVLSATLAVGVVAAMLVQLAKGFTALDPGEYIAWFLLPGVVDMALVAGMALVLQVLSPNKYIGWGLLLVYFVVISVMDPLGFQHPLYQYGSTGPNPLSDMNGNAVGGAAGWWFRLYWVAFLVIMLTCAHLLWRRGTETRFAPRLRFAMARARGGAGLVALAGLVVMGATGAWLYHQTNGLNRYETSLDTDRHLAEAEKQYLHLEHAPEPSVTAIRMMVDLHPRDNLMEATGTYALINRAPAPIRDVHLVMPEHARDILALSISGAQLVSDDDVHQVRFYRFDRPLAPGATATMAFKVRRWQRGISARGDDQRLVANGTFLDNSEIAPVIGIHRSAFLSDPVKRRRYGLPSELRMAKLEDSGALAYNYIDNADWVTSDITLTTDADQTPVAPGKRVSDTTAQGRRTARFVSTAPILNFWSIQSARYAVKSRMSDGVTLSVYYDPAHPYNVDRLLSAFDTALHYYRANFGPYQFDYARIVEFPGYAAFAQAFAGTMPYSENIGFLGDFRNPANIDYATYVASHELGHQYWAHQVISADRQGGTLMVETLAQYSALMVMKHRYGEDKIRRFLQYELDSYLRSRGGERLEEQPLLRVENQGYIHYRKGAVALYLLQDRLGEDRVNAMLRTILAKYRFKGAPFASSTDLVDGFHALARNPQEAQLVTDTLDRITLYDFKAQHAVVRQLGKNRWQTVLTVRTDKAYADGKGHETPAGLNQSVDIGLFTARPGKAEFGARSVLLRERRAMTGGVQTFTLVTRQKPLFAGIDPYNTFIDRNSDDNIVGVTQD